MLNVTLRVKRPMPKKTLWTRKYYKGQAKKDAKRFEKGEWVVGRFMPRLPHKTESVEIKYWRFPKKKGKQHSPKMCRVFECTFILEGEVRGLVGNDWVTLQKGDYVIIRPGVRNNLIHTIMKAPLEGITIKAPSIMDPNRVLDE